MTDIQSTKMLQLQSLYAFAEALGYYVSESAEGGENFYSCSLQNKHRSTVSFKTMIDLYNNKYLESHGKTFNPPFEVDPYTFNKAQSAKIVWQLKLQYSKKKRQIICQSDIVCFVDERYVDMFLENNDE